MVIHRGLKSDPKAIQYIFAEKLWFG